MFVEEVTCSLKRVSPNYSLTSLYTEDSVTPGHFSHIALYCTMPKINCLVTDPQSFNQHRLLKHVRPDFQFASLRLTLTMMLFVAT